MFHNLEAYPLISNEVLDSVAHPTDEDFVKSLNASLAQREPTWPEFATKSFISGQASPLKTSLSTSS